MKKKYDVYGIGNALVDLEFQVDKKFFKTHNVKKGVMTLVDEGTQFELIKAINQKETKQKPGGSAANAMMAISQLGGKAFYSCKIADDSHGQFYIKDMHNAGIDTNFIRQKPEAGITGKCLVMITADADRTMNTFLGVTAELSTREVDEQAIKEASYVYVEGYLIATDAGFEAMKRVKKLAEKHGVKTALTLSDPSIVEGFKGRFAELSEHPFDLLFCNEEEAEMFTGSNSLIDSLELLKKSAQQFAVTQGPDGAVLYGGEDVIEIDPIEVEAVDTNGAGDIFSGAFLYGITNGMNFEEAGKLANRAGAKVVSQYGPRLQKEEMQELIKTTNIKDQVSNKF